MDGDLTTMNLAAKRGRGLRRAGAIRLLVGQRAPRKLSQVPTKTRTTRQLNRISISPFISFHPPTTLIGTPRDRIYVLRSAAD